MDQLKFTIPGKPEYLTMLRLAISSVAVTAGFDLDGAEDIKTAVSEACKNCPTEGNIGVYVIQTLMNEVEINVLENGQKSIKMVKYL